MKKIKETANRLIKKFKIWVAINWYSGSLFHKGKLIFMGGVLLLILLGLITW